MLDVTQVEAGRWHLNIQASQQNQLLAMVLENGWTLTEFAPRRQALEELFTSLVNSDYSDAQTATRNSQEQMNLKNDQSDQTHLAHDDAPTLILERESES